MRMRLDSDASWEVWFDGVQLKGSIVEADTVNGWVDILKVLPKNGSIDVKKIRKWGRVELRNIFTNEVISSEKA